MKELTLIQSELKAPKGNLNKFGGYQYRTCDDIFQAVKPLIAKYECELIVSDEYIAGDVPVIKAIAALRKGDETISVSAFAGIDINQKGMAIPQTFGSASSYARKYALNGLFLIDDTKDDDVTNTHGKDTEQPKQAPANKKQVQVESQKQADNAPESLATVKQKAELTVLLNNKLITQDERDSVFKSINSFTPERADKAISFYKREIDKRTPKEPLNA